MAIITIHYNISEQAIKRIQWHTDWSRRKTLKEIRRFLLSDTYRAGDNMEIIQTGSGFVLLPLDPEDEESMNVALITNLFG